MRKQTDPKQPKPSVKSLKENRIQNPWNEQQPKKEVGFGALNSIIAQHYGDEYIKGEAKARHD